MMKFAVNHDGPIAVRYPRGAAYDRLEEHRAPIVHGKGEVIKEGEEIALLAVGSMVKTAESVQKMLEEQGIKATFVNMRFVKPFDTELLKTLSLKHKYFVTLEENVVTGGFGERVSDWMCEECPETEVLKIAIPDQFVTHGSVDYLYKELKMDAESVTMRILDKWYR